MKMNTSDLVADETDEMILIIPIRKRVQAMLRAKTWRDFYKEMEKVICFRSNGALFHGLIAIFECRKLFIEPQSFRSCFNYMLLSETESSSHKPPAPSAKMNLKSKIG